MIWLLILYLIIGVLSAELGTSYIKQPCVLTYPIVVLVWPFLWLLAILITVKVFTL